MFFLDADKASGLYYMSSTMPLRDIGGHRGGVFISHGRRCSQRTLEGTRELVHGFPHDDFDNIISEMYSS
jgi:hypothetical protein